MKKLQRYFGITLMGLSFVFFTSQVRGTDAGQTKAPNHWDFEGGRAFSTNMLYAVLNENMAAATRSGQCDPTKLAVRISRILSAAQVTDFRKVNGQTIQVSHGQGQVLAPNLSEAEKDCLKGAVQIVENSIKKIKWELSLEANEPSEAKFAAFGLAPVYANLPNQIKMAAGEEGCNPDMLAKVLSRQLSSSAVATVDGLSQTPEALPLKVTLAQSPPDKACVSTALAIVQNTLGQMQSDFYILKDIASLPKP